VCSRSAVVGGDEVLALPVANDDAAGVADTRGHDRPRIGRRDECERGGPLEPGQHRERAVLERLAALQLVLQEVHDDLGVGLGGEGVPRGDERRLQRLEVLDDPVVDDRGRARAVDVRMRIRLRRPAVRRPPGVADAGIAFRGALRDDGGEVVELAFGAAHLERAFTLDRDARGVVAAVLEAAQPAHQQRKRLARPGVADDPTHG
jgi:hypothetical protein